MAALAEFAAVPPRGRHKVRVLLSREGKLVVESATVTSISGGKVAVARQAISRHTPLLRHKTTYRKPYSDPLQDQQARDPAIIDVILWDEAGNVTESGMANLVVRLGGALYTPSLQQNLLPGVFRRSLLEQWIVRERQITVAELHGADAVFLGSTRCEVGCRWSAPVRASGLSEATSVTRRRRISVTQNEHLPRRGPDEFPVSRRQWTESLFQTT